MAIDNQDVVNIAHLARLEFQESDIPQMAEQLSGILSFVEQINHIETDHIEPMAHPFEAFQRLRPDQVTEVNQRDDFQAIAPDVEAGFYLVPKVIE